MFCCVCFWLWHVWLSRCHNNVVCRKHALLQKVCKLCFSVIAMQLVCLERLSMSCVCAHYSAHVKFMCQDRTPTASITFLSGAAASVAATLLTQPADVIRTHMQLNLGRTGAHIGPLATLQGVMRLGPTALFAGAAPRVITKPDHFRASVASLVQALQKLHVSLRCRQLPATDGSICSKCLLTCQVAKQQGAPSSAA